MKTRNGFVSNSSSTSFIVAVKKDLNVCIHCGRSDPNIIKLIEQYNNSYDCGDDTQVDATGWERVLRHETDHRLGYMEDEISKQEIVKLESEVKPYLTDEWEIASISISYHDELTNDIFESGKKNGSIVVIRKSE